MEKNDLPFHFGTVVSGDLFYDREADARNLHDLVAGGQNVVLYAPRRYGKSSLVLKVAEAASAISSGFVTILRYGYIVLNLSPRQLAVNKVIGVNVFSSF